MFLSRIAFFRPSATDQKSQRTSHRHENARTSTQTKGFVVRWLLGASCVCPRKDYGASGDAHGIRPAVQAESVAQAGRRPRDPAIRNRPVIPDRRHQLIEAASPVWAPPERLEQP